MTHFYEKVFVMTVDDVSPEGREKPGSSSRRDVLRAMAAGTAVYPAVDLMGSEAGLFLSGQAPYQSEVEAYQPAMKKVVAGEPIDIRTTYIHFGEGEGFAPEPYCDSVKSALETLDELNVEIHWDEVELSPESWKKHDDSGRTEDRKEVEARLNVMQMEERMTGDTSYAEKWSATYDILEHYGTPETVNNEDLWAVIAPYSLKPVRVPETEMVISMGAGVAGGGTALIKSDGFLPLDQTAIHEHGHQFGLEHAHNPADVMSYGSMQYLNEAVTGSPFTDESHQRWQEELERAKNRYG